MAKRSEFDRIKKDFYRTSDKRAVDALSPHLEPNTIYAEPCYGSGDLVLGMAEHGHSCGWASDIDEPSVGYQMDALEITEDHLESVSEIITNPPWSRPLLHKMIYHFSSMKPTWLLFDADWAHTSQRAMAKKYGVKTAPELMERCTDIVSVGRLIWIPGTTMSGKDNCAWYRFSTDKSGPTKFHGRTH